MEVKKVIDNSKVQCVFNMAIWSTFCNEMAKYILSRELALWSIRHTTSLHVCFYLLSFPLSFAPRQVIILALLLRSSGKACWQLHMHRVMSATVYDSLATSACVSMPRQLFLRQEMSPAIFVVWQVMAAGEKECVHSSANFRRHVNH